MCAGDVVGDVLVDGCQGVAEVGWCWGLVGGHQRSEETVREFGVEDRESLSVGGEGVGVGVLDPLDQAF